MLKNTVFLLIGCFLIATAFLSGCAPDREGRMRLTYGEVNPDGHPITEGAREFARLVEEKTDGRITISVYPSGQLGSEREQIQSLQAGGLDFFRANANSLPDFGSEKMSILALPYIFEGRDHMWAALNGPIGKEVLQDLEGMRMVGLAYFDDGHRHFFARRKIENPKDLKGLRIRVPQIQIMADMVEAFDASPTPISYGELYSALQSGVVDGAENTLTGYLTNSFYEPNPYLVLNAHVTSPGVVIASELRWNRLSDEDREIIMEAAAKASDYVREKTIAYDKEAMDELEEKGVTIVEVDDFSPWREAVEPLHERYGEKHRDLVEAIRDTR